MHCPRLFLFSVCSLVAFVSVLLSGQSNSVVHAGRPKVLADVENAPAAMFARAPAEDEPQVKLGVVFGKPTPYDSGGYFAESVVIGDLNGDGRLDLVVANLCASAKYGDCIDPNENAEVGVLLGTGDGTFQPVVSYSAGVLYGTAVAIGDFNGDGHADLVVAGDCQSLGQNGNCANNGGIGVLLGNGDGTFQTAVTYSSGGVEATSVAIADLNGDGIPDLVVANRCQNGYVDSCVNQPDRGGVGVLLGNGDGTFEAPVTYGSGGYSGSYGSPSVAVADLNGDGHPDIVVTNNCQSPGSDQQMCTGPGEVGILLGNGDGTFQAPVTYSPGYYANALAIGDVNGDGYPDLVVTYACQSVDQDGNCTGQGVGALVGVFLSNGDGTFQGALSYKAGSGYSSIAIGDVNGDGIPDLLITGQIGDGYNDYSDGTVGVLLGNGNGTFRPPITYSTGGTAGAVSVAIGDLNGDGKPDAAVASRCANGHLHREICDSDGVVGVLLNEFTAKTTTKVTSSLDPSKVSQTVTFTATVTSNPPIPDGEVVTFYSGASEIGTGTTSNGIASLTTSFSTAGKYTLEGSYPGDLWHEATLGRVKQVVKP